MHRGKCFFKSEDQYSDNKEYLFIRKENSLKKSINCGCLYIEVERKILHIVTENKL
jgi:hypothetical protein